MRETLSLSFGKLVFSIKKKAKGSVFFHQKNVEHLEFDSTSVAEKKSPRVHRRCGDFSICQYVNMLHEIKCPTLLGIQCMVYLPTFRWFSYARQKLSPMETRHWEHEPDASTIRDRRDLAMPRRTWLRPSFGVWQEQSRYQVGSNHLQETQVSWLAVHPK